MKLFLLGIILLTSAVRAENWMRPGEIHAHGTQAYSLKKDCGDDCLDVGSEPQMVKAGMASAIKDWGPETDVEECSDEPDCTAKLSAKSCGSDEKFISSDYSRVYCSHFIGYVLVKDQAAWDAQKVSQAQAAALEAGIAYAQNLRKCGERVMALMLVRNQPKGLTSAQVKQMVSVYAPVKALLESGSLVSAKEEIQAASADGVLVTEADKAALVAETNKCLGL